MSKGAILELMRFAVVGVINTFSALIVIYALMLLGANAYLSNLIGYSVGLVISFTLNRKWTFRSDEAGLRILHRFLAAVCAAYGTNVAAVYLCIEAGISPYYAQLIGLPVYTAIYYILGKKFVFTTRKDAEL